MFLKPIEQLNFVRSYLSCHGNTKNFMDSFMPNSSKIRIFKALLPVYTLLHEVIWNLNGNMYLEKKLYTTSGFIILVYAPVSIKTFKLLFWEVI